MNLLDLLKSPEALSALGTTILQDALGTKRGGDAANTITPLVMDLQGNHVPPAQIGAAAVKALFAEIYKDEPHMINQMNAAINKTPGTEAVHHAERVVADGALDAGLHASEVGIEARIGGSK